MARGTGKTPTVIRISPMAHIASAFVAIALLTVGPAFGMGGLAVLMAIPVLISVAIERFRTTADEHGVTARTMLKSTTMHWSAIEGLKFTRGRWARACLGMAGNVVLPAVTFSTLPALTAASGGKVPNPYKR